MIFALGGFLQALFFIHLHNMDFSTPEPLYKLNLLQLWTEKIWTDSEVEENERHETQPYNNAQLVSFIPCLFASHLLLYFIGVFLVCLAEQPKEAKKTHDKEENAYKFERKQHEFNLCLWILSLRTSRRCQAQFHPMFIVKLLWYGTFNSSSKVFIVFGFGRVWPNFIYIWRTHNLPFSFCFVYDHEILGIQSICRVLFSSFHFLQQRQINTQ